jgi:hypothetical protein
MRALLPAIFCSPVLAWVPAQPCATSDHAKALAEVETRGEAVTALPVEHDGVPGWIVDVHMPGKDKGWRVLIDRELAKVRWKDAIDNPPSKRCPVK